jgi:hypothetical protein
MRTEGNFEQERPYAPIYSIFTATEMTTAEAMEWENSLIKAGEQLRQFCDPLPDGIVWLDFYRRARINAKF